LVTNTQHYVKVIIGDKYSTLCKRLLVQCPFCHFNYCL